MISTTNGDWWKGTSTVSTGHRIWLVVSNMAFIFHFIYGMSSFPLTETMLVAIEHGHIPLLVGGDWNMAGLQNP